MSAELIEMFEDFASLPVSETGLMGGDGDLQSEKLASFEDGYKAGWDDAVAAKNEDFRHISSDFAQHLQDLSFTFQEAVAHVVKSTSPLLEQMVNLLLPEIARHALGLQIIEQLQVKLRDVATAQVQINVWEGNYDAVNALMDRDFGFPVQVVPLADLKPGQAELRFAENETQIDLDEVVEGIGELIQGFLFENSKAMKHG